MQDGKQPGSYFLLLYISALLISIANNWQLVESLLSFNFIRQGVILRSGCLAIS